MQKFIVKITNEDITLIADRAIECFMADSSLGEDSLSILVAEARHLNKIILICGENACEICQKVNADGVLIDLSASEHCAKDVKYARRQIGNKVLGVISRSRRHEAMLISECEPDFVAFKAWNQGVEHTQELVSWYTEMFLIQSAVVFAEAMDADKVFDCDILIGNPSEYKIFVAKK